MTENKIKQKVRIGCASAFYGDSQLAARQLVDGGDLDYLVFDYLAESTMAILARAHMRDEKLGYAVDFVTVAMAGVLEDCVKKGIKIVANAGGVNVPGCIKALEGLAEKLGLKVKIAGVFGDDLSNNINSLSGYDLSDIDDGTALPEKLASINAYLGARPIADALKAGADIVVTGRVVDSAVVLGPLMAEFDWTETEHDRLAQGSLAGHVLECGAQCTGGNFTDWHLVPDFSTMSYPIATVHPNGEFTVTIPPGSGGMVSRATIGEQILYEIGDPANYLLPDVACDFSGVSLGQVGKNCVKVSGAKGRKPGKYYKACATYIDGYRLMGSFYMAGLRAPEKARANLDAWLARVRAELSKRGLPDFRDVSLDVIGSEAIYGPHANAAAQPREVMGKFGLHHDNKQVLAFAAAEMAYLATSAAPGMTGFGGGRARPQPSMKVHSCMVPKDAVPVKVMLGQTLIKDHCYEGEAEESSSAEGRCYPPFTDIAEHGEMVSVPLETIAYARSGDKGDHANIGVMARDPKFIPFIGQQVTTERVADHFRHLCEGEVTRYDLPGFDAFNFLLKNALGGGATASLRLDSQGKNYGQILLSMSVDVPKSWI